jgi:cell division protein FtsL
MGRTFNIIAAMLIILLAVGLYKAKSEADAARAHVAKLQTEVDTARARIRTLSAEAAYLENPARVETLARRELGLKPAGIEQHKRLSELDDVLPAPAAAPAPPAAATKTTATKTAATKTAATQMPGPQTAAPNAASLKTASRAAGGSATPPLSPAPVKGAP